MYLHNNDKRERKIECVCICVCVPVLCTYDLPCESWNTPSSMLSRQEKLDQVPCMIQWYEVRERLLIYQKVAKFVQDENTRSQQSSWGMQSDLVRLEETVILYANVPFLRRHLMDHLIHMIKTERYIKTITLILSFTHSQFVIFEQHVLGSSLLTYLKYSVMSI